MPSGLSSFFALIYLVKSFLAEETTIMSNGSPPVFEIGQPRALDGTGRQNATHFRPGNLQVKVVANDGGPCNVRQIIGVVNYGGLQGTAW